YYSFFYKRSKIQQYTVFVGEKLDGRTPRTGLPPLHRCQQPNRQGNKTLRLDRFYRGTFQKPIDGLLPHQQKPFAQTKSVRFAVQYSWRAQLLRSVCLYYSAGAYRRDYHWGTHFPFRFLQPFARQFAGFL